MIIEEIEEVLKDKFRKYLQEHLKVVASVKKEYGEPFCPGVTHQHNELTIKLLFDDEIISRTKVNLERLK